MAFGLAFVASAQQKVVVGSDAYPPAADPAKFHKVAGYSPYAGRRYPERPLFGDEHVHTSWSGDAGMGGTTLGPEEALRFARGEEVVSTSGQPVRLSRPLDWIAVTDHSDGMGTIAMIRDGNPEMMADPMLKRWHDLMAKGGADAQAAMMELIAAQTQKKLPKLVMDPRFAKTTWERNNDFAEKYNEPGRFTALIGYEWTSNAGGGDNLHRNVIYRDGKAKADQVLPMTTFVSENPEDLWAWMANWEKQTGGRLLAIPHNGNLSNGRMFELQTFDGGPLDEGVGRAAREVGAVVRGHPVQGPERGAPQPVADRRIHCGLRTLGPRQPDTRAEKARHDRARIPARGPEERAAARAATRRESVQVRHGGRHRHAQRAGRRGRGQLLRQVRLQRAECRARRTRTR